MRLEGPSQRIWEAYPESWLGPVEVLTDLGGPEGAILILAIIYWVVDRERAATVASYVIVGGAFMLALKFALEMGRPAALMDVEAVIDDDDPYGFPSGHALTAVVLYGGLLYVFDKLDDWRYVLSVGALMLFIMLSRIFLRVHFVGDLIVGALLGVVTIVFLEWVSEDIRVLFGIGLIGGVAALFASGFHEYTMAIFGISLGAFIASFFLQTVPPCGSRVEAGLLVSFGLVYLITVTYISELLVEGASGFSDGVIVVGSHTILVIGVFMLPLVVHPVERHRQRVMDPEESV